MTPPTPPEAVVLCLSALAAALAARLAVRPTPRLARRVRPHTVAARSGLGLAADRPDVELGVVLSGGTLRRLVAPLVAPAAVRVGRLLDSTSDDALRLRLRQAGLLADVPPELQPQEYRVRQIGQAALLTVAFGGAVALLGRGAGAVLVAAACGFVVGATRCRARLDAAIETRRLRMQLELYTVNQLLAMTLRVGGGVVQAVTRVVERGRGEVVTELADVLAAHRSGRRLSAALEHAAQTTPEPHAARTYRLLATGVEYGADLAEGLRALSADIRDQHRETLRRAATRRRAATLVPIIAVLAPLALLFVAAPLPSIVFGAR